MKITITDNLPVQVGYIIMQQCQNQIPQSAITELLVQTSSAIQEKFHERPLSEDPTIAQIRTLFRTVGIDPTHYRPSGEALMRRALKGEAVRSINSVVDINNICSMESGLPFGAYDLEKIQGDITIRLGKITEQYQGVAKPIDIAEKLCAADNLGAFGSPISDSDRTKVTRATTTTIVLCFGHSTTPTATLTSALTRFQSIAHNYIGAQLAERGAI